MLNGIVGEAALAEPLAIWLAVEAWAALSSRIQTELAITPEQAIAMMEERQ